jgi:plasmid maintenance system antidote protein VapI
MIGTIDRRRGAAPALTNPSRALVEAVEHLRMSERTLAGALGVALEDLSEIRRGTRVLSLPQALTVARRLREHAALLQLAAEAAAEAVQSDRVRPSVRALSN